LSLAHALNIADLRKIARRRLPRMMFDYIDGGADDEVTLQRNEASFRNYELVWDALVDVANVDTSTTILGAPMRLPFFIGPTAATRQFNPRAGELAVARAAERAGVVYCCAALAATRMEDVAAAIPASPRWFQAWIWKDRSLALEMLDRAKRSGFTAMILTVDVPIPGNRERDPRNGLSMPPKANWQTVSQMLARPGYLWDFLTSPKLTPANFTEKGISAEVMTAIAAQFDLSVTWDDARWLREQWGGKFAIKGVSTAADARRAMQIGADAIWVSNHGGRQLDSAPASIDTLAPIVREVNGAAEVIFDGGIRRGTDIIKALAMGANAVALGRAYLWGLAAGGEAGVTRAISMLEQELRRDMMLMGRAKISDIKADLLFDRG
jgi:L-lactate dehydrogenase (cytochrome)